MSRDRDMDGQERTLATVPSTYSPSHLSSMLSSVIGCTLRVDTTLDNPEYAFHHHPECDRTRGRSSEPVSQSSASVPSRSGTAAGGALACVVSDWPHPEYATETALCN